MPFQDGFDYADGTKLFNTPDWTSDSDAGELYPEIYMSGVIGTGSAVNTLVHSPEEASDDHLVIARFMQPHNQYGASIMWLRADGMLDNGVGVTRRNSFALGTALVKLVGGVQSDVWTGRSSDPGAGEVFKIEAEGTEYRFYSGGVGATPVWELLTTEVLADVPTTNRKCGLMLKNVHTTLQFVDEYVTDIIGGAPPATVQSNAPIIGSTF